MGSSLIITIKDPKLAGDLEALAAGTKESTDEFVSRILQIAIDAAVERGKRRIAKEGKAKSKRG